MARGRKRTPAAVKKLQGNPSKRKIVADPAPMPHGEHVEDAKRVASFKVPPPPKHLSKMARDEWSRIANEMTQMGLLRNLDMTALEMCCESIATARRANKVLARRGMTYAHKGLVKTRPEVRIAGDAMRQAARFLSEFGLTPAARARVTHVTPLGAGEKQPELPLPGTSAAAADSAAIAASLPPIRDLDKLSDAEFFRG